LSCVCAFEVIAHKSTAAEIGILRKFFQQYDTAGIGHLNYDQFKSAISAVGYTEQDYRKIFEAVVRETGQSLLVLDPV
jgi:Ca2+-binding EF-hand superfamily protein